MRQRRDGGIAGTDFPTSREPVERGCGIGARPAGEHLAHQIHDTFIVGQRVGQRQRAEPVDARQPIEHRTTKLKAQLRVIQPCDRGHQSRQLPVRSLSNQLLQQFQPPFRIGFGHGSQPGIGAVHRRRRNRGAGIRWNSSAGKCDWRGLRGRRAQLGRISGRQAGEDNENRRANTQRRHDSYPILHRLRGLIGGSSCVLGTHAVQMRNVESTLESGTPMSFAGSPGIFRSPGFRMKPAPRSRSTN